jgi:hypothetical protein
MDRGIFGLEGNDFYVNSADNRGREYLDEHFPQVSIRGSVELTAIHEMVCNQEQVEIGDLIVGRVAIRKYIEDSGVRVRNNQLPYEKRQANNLKKKADFIQTLEVSSEYSLKWTLTSSLDSFMDQQAEAGRIAHRTARSKCKDVDVLAEY